VLAEERRKVTDQPVVTLHAEDGSRAQWPAQRPRSDTLVPRRGRSAVLRDPI